MKALTRVLTVSLFASLPGLASSDVVGGVSSDEAAQGKPGDLSFDPPCLFNQTLPLSQEMNPATNANFLLGNGAVLDECSSFGVSGFSPPNFLAFNCNATNFDGTTPQLPQLIWFPSAVKDVSAKIGSSVHAGESAGIVAFDSAFNLIDFDQVVLTPALQNVSVSSGSPNIQLAYIFGSCRMVVDDIVATATDCSIDTDQDRLPDCAETNTGVFVSANDTGTDPNNPDTDGDALMDGDEVLGTLAGLDLPGLGTSPLRADILIEYDWFVDSLDCASHSHQPSQAAVNRVGAAYDNSPVSNPDGSTGINFIQDRGQGGLFTGGNQIADANGVLVGGVNSAEFQNHKAANFAANREGYFHYTILPHRYNTTSGSSGQAELPGDDLIVSLQCFLSDNNVSNTIMHELGHNLLLRHGGNENCNYKPNYNSVMNYEYQFPGVDNDCTPPGNGVLDYSVGDRITLNETNLNEFNGTCGPGNPWDWNSNAIIQASVAFDVNPSGNATCGGTLTTLRDYDDWDNLNFAGLLDADGAMIDEKELIECMNTPQ